MNLKKSQVATDQDPLSLSCFMNTEKEPVTEEKNQYPQISQTKPLQFESDSDDQLGKTIETFQDEHGNVAKIKEGFEEGIFYKDIEAAPSPKKQVKEAIPQLDPPPRVEGLKPGELVVETRKRRKKT